VIGMRLIRKAVLPVAVLIAAATAAPRGGSEHVRAAGLRLPSTLAVIEPGQGLGAITSGGGDAWIDDRWSERLVHVDRRTGKVVARIPVDGRLALDAGGRDVWALQSGGGYGRGLRGPLLRIDAATNRVKQWIVLRPPWGEAFLGFGVLARGDSVWVWGPQELVRLDARDGSVAQVISVADERGETTGFALVSGQPIVTTADGHLLRFDPISGREVAAATLPFALPVLQTAGADRAIVTARGTVAAVDPSTGTLLWSRRLGFRLGTVLEARGALWAHGANLRDPGDRVWEIDPATGAVRGSVLLPAFGSTGMAIVDGTLWVSITSGRVMVLPLPSTRGRKYGA
jgi:PQQ-like domain